MPPATDAPAITRSAAIARRCRTCSSTCSSMRKAPRESVLDLDATPCTATRKAGSSTAIMTVTVICRSMCSAAVSCWRQNCGARTSTPRPAPRTRWRASSPASAGAGPRYGSCFAREELMAWCEEQRVDYLFGLARNSRLLDEIAIDLAWAEAEHQETGKPARRFKDFFYATRDSRKRRRRVIGKAEHLAKGANPRFIVTSLKRKAIDAQSFHPIDRKGLLGVDRFSIPKRAVVIKDGDPLLAGTSSALPGVVTSVTNSTIAPFSSHVPGRQRI